jgi:hypothetical protein
MAEESRIVERAVSRRIVSAVTSRSMRRRGRQDSPAGRQPDTDTSTLADRGSRDRLAGPSTDVRSAIADAAPLVPLAAAVAALWQISGDPLAIETSAPELQKRGI